MGLLTPSSYLFTSGFFDEGWVGFVPMKEITVKFTSHSNSHQCRWSKGLLLGGIFHLLD